MPTPLLRRARTTLATSRVLVASVEQSLLRSDLIRMWSDAGACLDDAREAGAEHMVDEIETLRSEIATLLR